MQVTTPSKVSSTASAIIKTACDGKNRCTILANDTTFGGDPAPREHKFLTISGSCSKGGEATLGANFCTADYAMGCPPDKVKFNDKCYRPEGSVYMESAARAPVEPIMNSSAAGQAQCPTGYSLINGKCYTSFALQASSAQASAAQASGAEASAAMIPLAPTNAYTCPNPTWELNEVYALMDGYSYTKDAAQAKCASYGGTLATRQQIIDAQAKGAGWCSWGWISDLSGGKNLIAFPVQPQNNCASSAPGVPVRLQEAPTGTWGANCYGPPPSNEMLPFNSTKWKNSTGS